MRNHLATTASEDPVSNTGWQSSLDIPVNEILAMDNFHFSRFRTAENCEIRKVLEFLVLDHFFASTASDDLVSRDTGRQNSLDISVNEILAMDNFHLVENISQTFMVQT